ncbi:MAG: hypothetical protein ACLPYY_01050 [Acidimicrobiales bacterium]
MSGSGNGALYTAAKLIDVGAVPITLSDSDGFVVDADGIDAGKLAWVLELKNVRRGRIGSTASTTRVPCTCRPSRPKSIRCGRWLPTAPSRAPRRTRSAARTPKR